MDASLARGFDAIRVLPEVMPDAAEGEVADLYDDIRSSLRVPFVNFIFRSLANFPDYLVARWKELRPVVRASAFDRAAAAVRSEGILSDGWDQAPMSSERQDLRKLRSFTATIGQVQPKLQLIATALDLGLTAGSRQADPAAYGVSENACRIPMASTGGETSDDVKALLERIRAHHGHPGIASYFRSLASEPWMLHLVWQMIEPVVGSDAYVARREAIVAASEARAQRLWDGPAATHARDETPINISRVFRLRLIPDLMIDTLLVERTFRW